MVSAWKLNALTFNIALICGEMHSNDYPLNNPNILLYLVILKNAMDKQTEIGTGDSHSNRFFLLKSTDGFLAALPEPIT